MGGTTEGGRGRGRGAQGDGCSLLQEPEIRVAWQEITSERNSERTKRTKKQSRRLARQGWKNR
jgi:hypothetical protein